MPEKRTLPVRHEHERCADHPGYPGRHRGRRLLGVDAYGFAHYRAGDWVEIVRHAAVVEDDTRPASGGYRRPDTDRQDGQTEGSERQHGPGEPSGRGDVRDASRTRGDGDGNLRVETDLVTVHEVPLHLVGVPLDEYLRTVGDYLAPVEALGFRPVEGGEPDRWEWVSPYALQWVEAFGDGEGSPDADGSGATA